MKLITVASKLDEKGLDNLVMSAQKFGFDIEVICTEWRGFGTKLIEVYNYFKQNPDVKELIFVDAYDVLVLSTPKEVEEKIKDRTKMLVSVEKACYPDSNLSSEYPETEHEWKYVNSGTYYAPREVFMSLFENDKPEYATDDQRWMTKQFLNNQDKINLDYDCEVFQCHSFVAEDDYEYKDGRVHNLRTLSTPILIHSNGRTDNTKVLQLL